jgi:hypothetical protein
MERHIPKRREYWIDICHWTDLGRETFANGVLEALGRRDSKLLVAALARR